MLHTPDYLFFWFFFQRELRDIGLVLMSDTVALYMTGMDDPMPLFKSKISGMTDEQFKNFCLDKLEDSISE